jgi:hypothetical protein
MDIITQDPIQDAQVKMLYYFILTIGQRDSMFSTSLTINMYTRVDCLLIGIQK